MLKLKLTQEFEFRLWDQRTGQTLAVIRLAENAAPTTRLMFCAMPDWVRVDRVDIHGRTIGSQHKAGVRMSRHTPKVGLLLCAIFLAIGLWHEVNARDAAPPPLRIYVDPVHGLDSNSGLHPTFPIKTNAKAAQIIAAQPARRVVILMEAW